MAIDRTEASFRTQLLGPFRVERDGVPLDAGSWYRPVQALLKILLLSPNRQRSKDEVIDLLWPASSFGTGATNLRSTLRRLRSGLGGGDPSPVWFRQGWVGLHAAYGWDVDVDTFEDMVRCGDGDLHTLLSALALVRGEPLIEDRYEEWAFPVRERIGRLYRDTLFAAAQSLEAAGEYGEAAHYLQRLVGDDPLHEDAVATLMRVLSAVGKRSDALRQYAQLAERLQAELGVAPGARVSAALAAVQAENNTLPRTEGAARTGHAGPLSPTPEAEMVVTVPTSYPLPVIGRMTIGRREAFDDIVAALRAHPRNGTSPFIVLVSGEPGIGKSVALSAIADGAREDGMCVLIAGCFEAEGRLPYGPFHDALLDWVMAQPDSVLARTAQGLEGGLVRIVPELLSRLAGALNSDQPASESQRLQVFSAVSQLLERISGERTLVLLLDDLHWADESTVQLLHFLFRQPRLKNLCIVGAYRQGASEVCDALDALSDRSPRRDRIRSLTLQPLTMAEMQTTLDEGLGEHCSPGMVETLYGRSGGNPLFALQMLRLLRQEGRLQQSDEGWTILSGALVELPPELHEAIARRLNRLHPNVRDVLELGAVAGREFAYNLLRSMWTRSEEDLYIALEAADDARLLIERGNEYTFRHPLMREVVLERIPAHRRVRFHEQAGLALERLLGADVWKRASELEVHFREAGDTERAIRYAVMAAERSAAVFAYADAERHYRAALALGQNLEDRARVARLQEHLGGVLHSAGHPIDAIPALEEAARLYRALGDFEGEARSTALLAQAHFDRGSAHEGALRVQALLNTNGARPPSPGLAAAHLQLAWACFAERRGGHYLALANQAADMARRVGDDRTLGEAEVLRALGLRSLGTVEEARGALACAISHAEALGDPNLLYLALTIGAETSFLFGEFERARTEFEHAMERTRPMGNQVWAMSLHCYLSWTSFVLGEWPSARRHAEWADGLVQAGEVQYDEALPSVHLGELLLAEGRWDEAEVYLERVDRRGRDGGGRAWLGLARPLLAELAIFRGRPERAVELLEPLVFDPNVDPEFRPLRPQVVWAYLEAGQVGCAEELAAAGLIRARRPSARWVASGYHRVHGQVLARTGRLEEARAALHEAATLARNLPYPHEEGRALYEMGNVLADLGDEAAAQDHLLRARAIFQRLGAHPFVQWTDEALSRV